MTSPTHQLPDRYTIADPRAIKSLLNPARYLAVDEIYSKQAPRTATELAALAGITPSAMSYHLRELEQFGIVQRGSADDGRERPWLPVARDYSILASDDDDSASRAGLIDVQLMPMKQRMLTVLNGRARKPLDERLEKYMVLTTGRLHVTDEELRTLQSEIQMVWERYERISQAHRLAGTPLARASVYMWSCVPEQPLVGD